MPELTPEQERHYSEPNVEIDDETLDMILAALEEMGVEIEWGEGE